MESRAKQAGRTRERNRIVFVTIHLRFRDPADCSSPLKRGLPTPDRRGAESCTKPASEREASTSFTRVAGPTFPDLRREKEAKNSASQSEKARPRPDASPSFDVGA